MVDLVSPGGSYPPVSTVAWNRPPIDTVYNKNTIRKMRLYKFIRVACIVIPFL